MKNLKILGLFAVIIIACTASQKAQETTADVTSGKDAVADENTAATDNNEKAGLPAGQAGDLSMSDISGTTENPDGAWVAPAWADTIKNPFAIDADAIALGKKVYNKYCWTCHGKSGKGDGPAGANLNPKPKDQTGAEIQQLSDGALFWKITTGNSPMAAYEKLLTEEQRWQVVSYIRELGK